MSAILASLIPTASTKKDSKGCKQVYQLPVTVQAGSDFSVEMTVRIPRRDEREVARPISGGSDRPAFQPPDFVTPVVQRLTLYFDINEDFIDYKGDAGVIVTVPSGTLQDVDASVSSIFNVLPGASTSSSSIDIDASTSATVYYQEVDDDDVEIDASTSATVVVLGAVSNTKMEVDIDAGTSASVFVHGAEDVEIDEASTSGTVSLVGEKLSQLDIDDLSTSAEVFAKFTGSSRMEIDDISTSGAVTVTGLSSIKIKDASTGATLFTDSQQNCDDVSDLTTGSFAGLDCTVTSDITVPATPAVPTTAVVSIDLSTVGKCSN